MPSHSHSQSQSPAARHSQAYSTPGTFPSDPGDSALHTIISSQLSLSQAVHKRKAEYTRSHTTRVKVGTWNVASQSGTEKDIGGWFVDGKGVSEALSGLTVSEEDDPSIDSNGQQIQVGEIEDVAAQERRRSKKRSTIPHNDPGSLPGGDHIGIYVLGLQEIVDVNSPTEALRPYSDPHPARKWKRAVAEALPPGYTRVAEQQLIGLLLLVYASPLIAPTISSVSTTSVGTGLMGYMGNKGAVTARIVLGETTRLVFVNCHMAAGSEKGSVERRNWDASQVLSRTKFEPVDDGGGVVEEFGEGIGDEDFAFWFGDLNYRLDDLPAEDVRRLLMLHTRNEYDTTQASTGKIDAELSGPTASMADQASSRKRSSDNESSLSSDTAVNRSRGYSTCSSTTLPVKDMLDPSSDPASLQTTLSSILPHDQLHAQMRKRKAFYDGWREGPIDFLPTYKYDVGSVGMFDSSEKRRGPSWCDRILYRTRRDKMEYEKKVQDEEDARMRDDEMKARGIDKTDEDVLFDYDPETDGADDEYDENTAETTDPEVVVTKAGYEDQLQLDYYTSHQRVLSSDHKPLDAVFTLTYDAVDLEMKAKVHQEVARELDKAENEGRPAVTVVIDRHHDQDSPAPPESTSPNFEGVSFGAVRYDQSKIRSVTIANTGRVPATVGFVDRPVDQGQIAGFSPSWLSINFDRPSDNENSNPGALQIYTIEPGDAVNVQFTLRITDMSQVQRLNDGFEGIEDVLVLRIENGRDHFIPIRGAWMQSAFGRSLDKLIRIPEGGVRRLQHQRPDGSGEQPVKWSAPRELFRLTESIEELVERSLAEWSMRDESGNPPWDDVGWPFAGTLLPEETKEMEALEQCVQESLDTDQGFSNLFPLESDSLQRLKAMTKTLLTFLQSLEDGIVTEAMWAVLEKEMLAREKEKRFLSGEEERVWVLDVLSSAPAHSVSFTFLTFMLARVANAVAPVQTTPMELRTSLEAVSGRARAQSQDPVRARRQLIDEAFANVFANVMIRTPATVKEKERKTIEQRKRNILLVFLRAKWEEDMG
ncbi:hypothetical protein MMC12_006866 [Toensbergia leucococca]|nr:hypothetical protein [Toensbergia leucococca]